MEVVSETIYRFLSKWLPATMELCHILITDLVFCVETNILGKPLDYSYGQNCPFIVYPMCAIYLLILLAVFVEFFLPPLCPRKTPQTASTS